MRVDAPDGRGGAAADSKKAMRAEMRSRRRRLSAQAPDAGERLAETCLVPIVQTGARVVAGYRPIADEIDVLPLLRALSRRGVSIAFPAVRKARMRFHVRPVDGVFEADECGAPAPPDPAPAIDPDLVIAPLLAFDARGGRLGYGGGWYDRALTALRARNSKLIAYGAAFSGQEVDYVARESHDFLLDGVFMELGAVRTAS